VSLLLSLPWRTNFTGPAFGGARRRKPGQEASKFKTDDDTGKMIVADSDSDLDVAVIEGKKRPSLNDALAGAAYKETLVSVDGFRRNPNGTIKFHKDTKKQRKEEIDMDVDMDMDPEDAAGNKRSGVGPQRTPKKKPAKIGQEFKAKVSILSLFFEHELNSYALTESWWRHQKKGS
jgi:ribosomal RNA-processing protein 12